MYIQIFTYSYSFIAIYKGSVLGFGASGPQSNGAMFVVARGFCLKGSCEGLYKP